MTALVQTSWPAPSVATITLTDTSTPNHNVTFRAIGQLADALSAARAAGARVLILASGVEGTWLNHAHLGDLRALMRGGINAQGETARHRKTRLHQLVGQPLCTIPPIVGRMPCANHGHARFRA